MMITSIVRRGTYGLSAVLLVALALAGCRNPAAADRRVEVTTDRRAYRAGNAVTVTVTNVSDEPVGHNLCVHRIERRAGDGWRVASTFPPPGSACIAILLTLEPGASTTTRVRLPQDLPAGIYRVRFESPDLATPSIRVEPGFVRL
jgi:uncharacterized protein (DUF58 family)